MTPEEELNQKWDNRKIIEETVKSLNMHSEPAPKTLETFAEIKTILAVQAEKHIQIDEKLDDIQTTVKETLKQTQATNGRVTKLEEWANGATKRIETNTKDIKDNTKDTESLKNYRWWFLGVGATIMVLGYFALKGLISSELEQHNKQNADKVVQLIENKYNLQIR